MKKIILVFTFIILVFPLVSCALPGMTVDFASIHRINSPETSAERYGSVRETVTVPDAGFSYTVDTVYIDRKIYVYEKADGAVTAISKDGAYYFKDGEYTFLLPCFQSYKDALAEYMTTVHPLDCDSRWQRSSVTEGGVETVVYYRAINPSLESEFSLYGLRDGAILTMTYVMDEATMRFISITYAEEYEGVTRVVCKRTFDYGLGFEFDVPEGESAAVTVKGETDVTYAVPSGCALGWLGTGTLYKDAGKTEAFVPSSAFPAELYK